MLGPYWKVMIFREAHIGTSAAAFDLVNRLIARFQDICPLHCLDFAAAKAWLEMRTSGCLTAETQQMLQMFDSIGAWGKKSLLTLQGFLTQNQTPDMFVNTGSTVRTFSD